MTGVASTITFDEIMRNQMTGYEGKEIIPLRVLETILENFEDIQKSREIIMKDQKGNLMSMDQSLTLLKKYKINRRQGKKITYRFARNRNNGRLFSQTLSGQGMSRPIRHTLFRDDYIDIDIVNCHPVLLHWFCSQNGWNCDCLLDYIENRDVRIQEVMDISSLNKEQVKTIILTIMNGGEIDTSVWNVPFLEKLKTEIEKILTNIKNSATPEEIKSRDYNVAGSILNHRLCCIENYILKLMVEFFKTHRYSNLILCFDGFMIKKSALDLVPLLQAHLDMIGIPYLKVIVKPMDDYIDLTPYISTTDLMINPPLDFDPDYTIDNFELEFAGREFPSMDDFKSKVIPKYCKVFAHFRDFPSPVYRCQDNKFQFGWCNNDFYNWKVSGQRVSLIDIVRLFPQYVPRYTNYDFYPDGKNVFGETCPPSILNIWSGFKASILDEFDMNKIEPILSHLKYMWADGDESIYEYFLDYFASIIQYPWKRTQVLILLFSSPRAGKNIITNFFLHMVIGVDYGSDNIGVDCLTARFNDELLRQLFVVLNELPELTPQTRKGVFDTLKQNITENTRKYEIKGGRKWLGPNFVNCIATTNHEFTYHIEEHDGRILAQKCSDRFCGDFSYFQNLANHLQQDNANHFITFLKQRKITHDLRNIPMTKLKEQMIEQSLPSPSRFINYIRDVGTIDDLVNDLFYGDVHLENKIKINQDISNGFISSSHLYMIYMFWCKRFGENPLSITATSRIWKENCKLVYEKKGSIRFFVFWQEKKEKEPNENKKKHVSIESLENKLKKLDNKLYPRDTSSTIQYWDRPFHVIYDTDRDNPDHPICFKKYVELKLSQLQPCDGGDGGDGGGFGGLEF